MHLSNRVVPQPGLNICPRSLPNRKFCVAYFQRQAGTALPPSTMIIPLSDAGVRMLSVFYLDMVVAAHSK